MNIEEADMARSLREAGDRVGHVHFADTNRSAVGMGHLKVSPLIQALRDINYTGYLSAEVFPLPSSIVAAEVTLESYRRYVS
jgi:sugar phosphate isomerase/epimerase